MRDGEQREFENLGQTDEPFVKCSRLNTQYTRHPPPPPYTPVTMAVTAAHSGPPTSITSHLRSKPTKLCVLLFEVLILNYILICKIWLSYPTPHNHIPQSRAYMKLCGPLRFRWRLKNILLHRKWNWECRVANSVITYAAQARLDTGNRLI